MRVLFCGDKHLKITRFDLAQQFIAWLNKTIKDSKPDLYVCLGDDLDTHAVVRSELLSEMKKHFDYILSLNIPIVYVVGNHDSYKPSDMKYHAFQTLKGIHKDLHIVDSVTELYGMTFVPYIHNPDNFPKTTLPICVAHQTFKGADYGDITTKDGVDAQCINGAELIISGHIHKRQRYDVGGVSILYPGSPFAQSTSDINQVKGISIIETSTLKESFIECPLPKWRGLRYDISQVFSIDDMHEEIQSTINKTDHWVIDITGPKSEIVGYLNSRISKDMLAGISVKVKTSFTDKERKTVRIQGTSVDQIVSQYIDKVYNGSLDKALLKSKALELKIT